MPCMWAIGNSSPITSGLLSYGVLFIKTGDFNPWKWFMGECHRNSAINHNLNSLFVFQSHHRGPDGHLWRLGLGLLPGQSGDGTLPDPSRARAVDPPH